MKSSARLLTASCVAAVVASMSVACGGPPKARSAAGERLPANGAPSPAPLSALPSKTIASNDWNKMLAEKIKPSCDAREGARTADARNLEGAGKVIGTWTEFTSKKGKSRTADAKVIAGGTEPTRAVDSIGMTCAAGASTVQVNGVQYPFDVAGVVSGTGTGTTLSGDSDVGQYAMIQAISYKDRRVVFAKVWVPSDAHNDTDDTVIVSNLASYLPDNAAEPVVRAASDRDNPQLETFITAKGATEGISWRVPEQDALGRARYLAVARFSVAQ
jgi:hypothetical protein